MLQLSRVKAKSHGQLILIINVIIIQFEEKGNETDFAVSLNSL